MTREDALEATIWLMDGNNQEECDERWGSNPLALINEIYDDFESRTCENCRHVGYRKSEKHTLLETQQTITMKL